MDISRFQKVYANLPVGLRNEIVVVMDDIGPMSWNASYVEVSQHTELGEKIMNKLINMELI